MKKTLLMALAIMAGLCAQAKVVRIAYADGSEQVLTSTELGAIDFNDDGTIALTAWDGSPIGAHDAMFSNISIGDDEAVTDIIPRTMVLHYATLEHSIDLFSREATYINFVYPSHDPMGQPITLSGAIVVPDNIMNGEAESEGIILSQHFTVSNKDEIPTRGYSTIESYLIANPLLPNYIMVCSDFYGFGATERFPQAFLYGTANGVASLDALLAAKRLLPQLGIECGELLFNVGYSSGAADAMATLRAAQTLPGYEGIHFDKTFCGGGPYDLRTMYRDYVERDSLFYLVAMPLTFISMNENGQLGIDYSDIFTPIIADHIDDWFLSKRYSTWPLCDSIGHEHRISDLLQPEYLRMSSAQARQMTEVVYEQSMTHPGWTPDTSEHIFLYHGVDDDYIPLECSRQMASYLTARGYTKSIIPGRTNLQTNFVMKGTGHLASTPMFVVQTVAAMKAWPLMYRGGQLNPIYSHLANADLNPVAIMRQLDSWGFDCRSFIRLVAAQLSGDTTGSGSIDYFSLLQWMTQSGIDFSALMQTLDDCGISLTDLIFDLLAYLNSSDTDEAPAATLDQRIDRMLDVANDPAARPDLRYAAQLRQLFEQ